MRVVMRSTREGERIAWRFKAERDSCEDPSIAPQGHVFVSDGQSIYRVDPDGHDAWHRTHKQWTPFRPCALADGGVAWAPSGKQIESWDEGGNPRWTWGENFQMQSIRPSVGPDGTVYVCVRKDNKPFICALDPSDGHEVWNASLPMHASAPPLPDGQGGVVVRCDDDRLMAFRSGGEKRLDKKLPERLNGRPALAPDGSVWISNDNGQLFRVSGDGDIQPMLEIRKAIRGEPHFGPDGKAYVTSHDHNVYAVRPEGGEAWHYDAGDLLEESVGILSDGTILVANHAGRVQALDSSGQPLWHEVFDFPPSEMAVDGGTAYIAGRKELVAIRPGGLQADLDALRAATEKSAQKTPADVPAAPSVQREGDWIVVGGVRIPVRSTPS